MKIVAIVKKFPNVIVIADEVYEWLVYEGHEMIRFGIYFIIFILFWTKILIFRKFSATLPGMFERTITIGSVGKTFSMTGWKIGWAIGPNSILKHLQAVHQNCVYTCGTPLQVSSWSFTMPECLIDKSFLGSNCGDIRDWNWTNGPTRLVLEAVAGAIEIKTGSFGANSWSDWNGSHYSRSGLLLDCRLFGVEGSFWGAGWWWRSERLPIRSVADKRKGLKIF